MDTILTRYLIALESKATSVKARLEQLVDTRAASGSSAFGDVFISQQQVEPFVAELSEAGVLIDSITPYCDYTKENRRRYGCPHGGGGPGNTHGYYYSEMYMMDGWYLPDTIEQLAENELVDFYNHKALRYVLEDMKSEYRYSPCLVAGVDLLVPDNWKHHRIDLTRRGRKWWQFWRSRT